MRFFAVLQALVVGLLALAAPAHAERPYDVASRFCVLGTDADITPEAALAQRARFDCSPDRFDKAARYLWMAADLRDAKLPEEALVFESDNAPVDGILVYARYADGRITQSSYDRRAIAEHWIAGTRFALPLGNWGAKPELLMLRIDNPWSMETLTTGRILSEAESDEQKMSRIILLALCCGFAIVPIIYSAAFSIVLRYRFMMLHAFMSLGVLAFTFSSSNLIMHFFPGTELWTRTMVSYCAFAFAGSLACFFTSDFIEEGKLGARCRLALQVAGTLLIIVGVVLPIWGPEYRFTARNIYHAAFIPMLAATIAAIWQARSNGSRAANYLMVGWGGILLFAIERIARGTDLYFAPSEFDFSIYYGLTFEAVVTAFGVADRVMTLRRERDLAMVRGAELAQLAETDGLTCLYNRRTLESRFAEWRQHGRSCSLAILDIDHFKAINDTYGHIVGDRVLCAVAEGLREHAGESAVAARIGGEEFAVLYSTANPKVLLGRLNALRATISRHVRLAVPELSGAVTVSAGAAPVDGSEFAVAHGVADSLLYEAKRLGRDRIELSATQTAVAA